MPSSTVENYVKQLYLEQQRVPGALVPMGRLAEVMEVAPGTATAMIKTLSDSGLVTYEPRVGVKLSKGGEQLALHVLRRHRLVELLLVRVLGLDWSEVHAEAEELEHVISDKVLDRIDAVLGHPTSDPHGDPIPTAHGKVPARPVQSLTRCDLNRPLQIARVSDQEAAFLQFVERNGLVPGARIVVEERDVVADAVLVRCNGRPALTLGTAAADKIFVSPAG